MEVKNYLNITYSDFLLLMNDYKNTFFISENQLLTMENELNKNEISVLVENKFSKKPFFLKLNIKSVDLINDLQVYHDINKHPLWEPYIKSSIFKNLKTVNEKIKKDELSLDSLKIQFEDYLLDLGYEPNSYAVLLEKPNYI